MEGPTYRKLIAWQKAHRNSLLIIDLLDVCNAKFNRVINQCISAATSIGANLAEGNAVRTSREKARYFEIALSSAYEFDNWLQILKDSQVLCKGKEELSAIEKENIEIIKILAKLISNFKF